MNDVTAAKKIILAGFPEYRQDLPDLGDHNIHLIDNDLGSFIRGKPFDSDLTIVYADGFLDCDVEPRPCYADSGVPLDDYQNDFDRSLYAANICYMGHWECIKSDSTPTVDSFDSLVREFYNRHENSTNREYDELEKTHEDIVCTLRSNLFKMGQSDSIQHVLFFLPFPRKCYFDFELVQAIYLGKWLGLNVPYREQEITGDIFVRDIGITSRFLPLLDRYTGVQNFFPLYPFDCELHWRFDLEFGFSDSHCESPVNLIRLVADLGHRPIVPEGADEAGSKLVDEIQPLTTRDGEPFACEIRVGNLYIGFFPEIEGEESVVTKELVDYLFSEETKKSEDVGASKPEKIKVFEDTEAADLDYKADSPEIIFITSEYQSRRGRTYFLEVNSESVKIGRTDYLWLLVFWIAAQHGMDRLCDTDPQIGERKILDIFRSEKIGDKLRLNAQVTFANIANSIGKALKNHGLKEILTCKGDSTETGCYSLSIDPSCLSIQEGEEKLKDQIFDDLLKLMPCTDD